MKKLITSMFALFIFISSSFAHSDPALPNEFRITEHWISLTTSFDIHTKTRKLGTLYRKFFSLVLTYAFFDPLDNQTATARSRFFSYTAHFDIYDQNQRLLGAASEQLFSFFPTFDIYANDASTRLAQAVMNFWGTTFTIYDPISDEKMALMHRSFFRLKNDWSIKITNRALFDSKNIDPRVLMTVLAFQGDRENWEKDRKDDRFKNSSNSKDDAFLIPNDKLRLLQEKITAVSLRAGLDKIQKPEPKILEHIAIELEDNYNAIHMNDDSAQTNREKLDAFVNYCLGLVESNDVPDVTKKGILYLLKMRLEGSV